MKRINRKMKYSLVLAPVLLFALFMIPMTSASAAEETFTITVETTVGGTVSGDGSGVYPYGTLLTMTAEANIGWSFGGWYIYDYPEYEDGYLFSSDEMLQVTFAEGDNVRLVAQFDEEENEGGGVSEVVVSPATASVIQGNSWQFSAEVIGTGGPTQTVTWTVEGGSAGTSINSSGLLTVASNETPSTLTVRATSTIDITKSGTATVTVMENPIEPPPPIPDEVIISPANPSVRRGTSWQFSATVTGEGNPPQTVTWTVTGGGPGTSISSSGLLTVATNEPSSTLTVRATSTVNTSVFGTTTVNIENYYYYGYGYGYLSVIINPTNPSMQRGTNLHFSATVEGEGGPPQMVTWAVTGGGVGTNINSDGVLSVAANEPTSTLTIKATSTINASLFGTATVTITGSITPTGGDAPDIPYQMLQEGRVGQIYSYTIQATGLTPMTWELVSGYLPPGLSLNPSTGAISGTPSTAGTFSFAVRASNSIGEAIGSLNITVREPATVTGVYVTPSITTVQKGTTCQFTASVSGAGNPDQTVTWYVTGGSYGTSINSNGLLTVAANETAATLAVRAVSTVNAAVSGTSTVTLTGTAIPGAAAPQPPSSQNVVRQTEPVVDSSAYTEYSRAVPEPISLQVPGTVASEDIGDDAVPFGRAPQTGVPDIAGVFTVFCVSFAIAAALWIYIILRKKVNRNNNGDE